MLSNIAATSLASLHLLRDKLVERCSNPSDTLVTSSMRSFKLDKAPCIIALASENCISLGVVNLYEYAITRDTNSSSLLNNSDLTLIISPNCNSSLNTTGSAEHLTSGRLVCNSTNSSYARCANTCLAAVIYTSGIFILNKANSSPIYGIKLPLGIRVPSSIEPSATIVNFIL